MPLSVFPCYRTCFPNSMTVALQVRDEYFNNSRSAIEVSATEWFRQFKFRAERWGKEVGDLKKPFGQEGPTQGVWRREVGRGLGLRCWGEGKSEREGDWSTKNVSSPSESQQHRRLSLTWGVSYWVGHFLTHSQWLPWQSQHSWTSCCIKQWHQRLKHQ